MSHRNRDAGRGQITGGLIVLGIGLLFLARNLGWIPGFSIIWPGVLMGRIDLLAKHRSEPRWLVIELKRDRTSDRTVGQILRYIGWVRQEMAGEGERVEGLIIARQADDGLRYAVSAAPDVTVQRYEVDFRLRDVT